MRRGGINKGWTAAARGPNGRHLCKWCLAEVPAGRQYWCGDGCVGTYLKQSSQRELRRAVWLRDRGVCALCPPGTAPYRRREWEADHAVPLIEGGAFGVENTRTLCVPHHREVTRRLAQRRAERRRA